jgi:sarcosine oxidase subunit gamma
MEINYVDKFSLLTSERLSNKNIVVSKKLQFSLQSIKSIFSINKYNGKDKKFNSLFKNVFGFVTPSISKFNINDNQLALWVRSNSFFIISDESKLNDLVSVFESNASITDQTGGWVIFNIEGKACRSLFEKLLTVDLEGFDKGKVIRTSIAGINCFTLCKSKFDQYNILCPISFYETMKSRLESLIKLI